MELEKSLYLQRRTEILQNAVVNVKCATTSTIESYTWTFRTTACDVISMITTTVPLKNGTIKELSKAHSKETRRYVYDSSPFCRYVLILTINTQIYPKFYRFQGWAILTVRETSDNRFQNRYTMIDEI